MNTILIAVAIWAAVGFIVAGLYAFFMSRCNTMRTASQRQIERETAAIQGQVPDAPSRPAEMLNVRSLCKERARQDARHQARMQDLYGTPPVNRYPEGDPCRIWWAIALAEAHTEIANAKSPINQFKH